MIEPLDGFYTGAWGKVTVMTVRVADIIKIMEKIAPARLAESWDNPGLQMGHRAWPVKKIWIALDPTTDVVRAACENKVDMLITHHPALFKPLKMIDFSRPVGSIIKMAAEKKLSVFSAHTNLDSVRGGINDMLAEQLGLINLRPLVPSMQPERVKLVIYVPEDHEEPVLNALMNSGSGTIGNYTCCSFRTRGRGTFKPGPGTRPYDGRTGELAQVNEIRLETVVERGEVPGVLAHLKESHPYEEMAYDVYPLIDQAGPDGLGRVGEVKKRMTLEALASDIKKRLGLKNIRVAGRPEMEITSAAICTGSGSGLLNDFISCNAQVFISGDLKYHDARDIQEYGLGLIDIGHFTSEHLMVQELKVRLERVLKEEKKTVRVDACPFEEDPYYNIS